VKVDVGMCIITHRTAELEESGTEPTSSNRTASAAAAERNHGTTRIARRRGHVFVPHGAVSLIGRDIAQVRVVGAHAVLCGRRSMPAQRDCRLLLQDDRCRGSAEGQVSRIVIVVGICTSHIATAAFAFEFSGLFVRGKRR
jgi:hypothetical protein